MGWFTPTRRPARRKVSCRPRNTIVLPAPKCVDCDARIIRTPGPGRAALRCPACKSLAKTTKKWQVAPGALVKVQQHFGLEHELYVRRSTGRQLRGSYMGKTLGMMLSKKLDELTWYHVIKISSSLSAEEASKVLLHEACHAKQREADPQIAHRTLREIRRHGNPASTMSGHRAYLNHPTEIEARAAETATSQLSPLMIAG